MTPKGYCLYIARDMLKGRPRIQSTTIDTDEDYRDRRDSDASKPRRQRSDPRKARRASPDPDVYEHDDISIEEGVVCEQPTSDHMYASRTARIRGEGEDGMDEGL